MRPATRMFDRISIKKKTNWKERGREERMRERESERWKKRGEKGCMRECECVYERVVEHDDRSVEQD